MTGVLRESTCSFHNGQPVRGVFKPIVNATYGQATQELVGISADTCEWRIHLPLLQGNNMNLPYESILMPEASDITLIYLLIQAVL
jgi:hypothetical protein